MNSKRQLVQNALTVLVEGLKKSKSEHEGGLTKKVRVVKGESKITVYTKRKKNNRMKKLVRRNKYGSLMIGKPENLLTSGYLNLKMNQIKVD